MKIKIYLTLLILLLIGASFRAQAANFTVPDWLKKSCVFIMKGDKAQGTGFLVWVKDQDRTFCYLVTAKHVVQPILENPNTPLSVRFNLKEEGKAEIITFPTVAFNGTRWLQHNNQAVDLAVMPLSLFDRLEDLETGGKIISDPSDDLFATADWIEKYKIGPGDDVFTMGLVPYLYSKDQVNLVLTRFGKISLLPNEEIVLPGGKQKAYFIDSQAFGGNSGGPVFVLIERNEAGKMIAGWRFALLGVVTQFVPSPLRLKEVQLQETPSNKKIQLIENTGITKVIPVDYLMDILFSEEQKKFRKKVADNSRKAAETQKVDKGNISTNR